MGYIQGETRGQGSLLLPDLAASEGTLLSCAAEFTLRFRYLFLNPILCAKRAPSEWIW